MISSSMTPSVHECAHQALMLSDPDEKCAAVAALCDRLASGVCTVAEGENDPLPVWQPGRPARPELVSPQAVPFRRPGSREGHAALLHAIVHIEFNAINLALDCVARFRAFPAEFHHAWLAVASEEALHFGLVRGRLRALGFDYGDFPAHNGLWEMACRTAHDPLARMALVPRVLEARGLDATPPIMGKLRRIGDAESVAVLEIILRDEVGHVALGDKWFRALCAERGLDAEQAYVALIESFGAPWPQPPLNEQARLAAGFSMDELERLGRK
ncbi:ferritin-like domain-containing protein [Azoarcus taiwanensis]|nr:ferritin-like domain-containing protein [Azoarcus taiwanensis]